MDEQKELLQKITSEVKEQLKGYTTLPDVEKAVTIEIAKIKDEFAGLKDLPKSIEALEKAAKLQGETLTKMATEKNDSQPLTIKAQLEKNADVLRKIAAGDRTVKTTVLPNSITTNFNGQVIPGVGQFPQRRNRLADIFASGTLAPNHQRTIRYMDTTTYTNAAAARTVGNAAAESAVAWTGRNQSIESISHNIPVAKEMLTEYDFVESEINNTLMRMLDAYFESELMNGTNSTPHINGVTTFAPDFTAATNFTDAFKSATELDLILAMATQIGYNTMYKPNYVLMNPYDALKLKLQKDEFGRLIYPNFISADGMNLDGLRIIPTELVTADELYVGDFSYATLFKTAPTIEIGWINTNFTEREVTLLANMEACVLVRTMFTGAFLHCTSIAADKLTINAGA